MKFTFNFNGSFVTNNNVDGKLDNIEVTCKVTSAEFADTMTNNREIVKSSPGSIDWSGYFTDADLEPVD